MTDVGGVVVLIPTPINRRRRADGDAIPLIQPLLLLRLLTAVTERAGLMLSITISNAAGPHRPMIEL